MHKLIAEKLASLRISLETYTQQCLSLEDLGYSKEFSDRVILRKSSTNTVNMLVKLYPLLIPHLNREQIISIAAHGGGSKNLEAVTSHLGPLRSLGFQAEQIVQIVSHGGGSKNLEAVATHLVTLRCLGLGPEQIVHMVSRSGGSLNLEVIIKYQPELEALEITERTVVSKRDRGDLRARIATKIFGFFETNLSSRTEDDIVTENLAKKSRVG